MGDPLIVFVVVALVLLEVACLEELDSNKSDCNLVLTTSNGDVTMAPVIPPTLWKTSSFCA